MKRTRRVEIVRYTRRVGTSEDGLNEELQELLAIATIEKLMDQHEGAMTLTEPVSVKDSRGTLRSRALKLLRKYKP